jgi:hypothetical protein
MVLKMKVNVKSVTYCIRLQDDEDERKKHQAKREIAVSAKGQHILNGLQKKLTPSPIIPLTTSVNVNYQIENHPSSRIKPIR